MAQIAVPNADLSAGSWTAVGGPSTLFDTVDDGMASDGAYMEDAAANSTVQLAFSSLTDPGGASSGTDHILRIRMQGNGGGGPERVTIALIEATASLATSGNFTSRGAWTTQTYTLTAAEADSITNYADLTASVVASNMAPGETVWVSGIEFEVPDPSVGGGTTYIQGGLINGGLVNTSLINDSLVR